MRFVLTVHQSSRRHGAGRDERSAGEQSLEKKGKTMKLLGKNVIFQNLN